MRTFKPNTQAPLSTLKQIILFGLVSCVAVSLFPFVRYHSNEATTVQQSAYTNLQFLEEDSPRKSAPSSNTYIPENLPRTQTSDLDTIKYTYEIKTCPVPDIPFISTTPESEAKTIATINRWIDCHNSWNANLNKLIPIKNNFSHNRQASIDAALKALIAEEQVKFEKTSQRYVEWKNNSLNYKRRLGYRQNLIRDSLTESH
mgnify:CR=1 FL=1